MMSVVTDSSGSRPPVSPAATRSRSAWWRDPRLAVGVALVAVSVLLGAALLGGEDDGVEVWSARVPLAEGQSVRAADLARAVVSFESQADADRYLSAAAAPPSDAVLTREVASGELLPRAALGAGEQTPTVEVPLVVPPGAVPSTLRVGSVVDVWVTPDAAARPGEQESELVLTGVRVVAMDRAAGGLGAGGDRQVIVGVGSDQEANLPTTLGRLAGGSVVLVRNP
jgi:hypothetical protein